MKSEKTIFIISPFLWTMGNTSGIPVIKETIFGFLKNGYIIYLIIPDSISTEQFEDPNLYLHTFFWRFSKSPNIPLIGFIYQKLSWIFFSLSSIITALKIIKTKRPVFTYCISFYSVIPGFLLSLIYKIPNINRLYGTFLYRYLKNPFKLLICFDQVLPFILPSKLLIITNDGTRGDFVARFFKKNPQKVKFWMNGVNKNLFAQAYTPEEINSIKVKFGIKQHKINVTAISRLVNWKRVDLLIRAIPSVIKLYNNIQFIIVGDGEEYPNLVQLTKDLNISQNVIFTRSVPKEDISKILSITDIFISLYDISNLGNPLIEAMTSGKAIITLDHGEFGGLLHNMQNCILMTDDDLPDLPDKILLLAENSNLRENLGNNARKTAELVFRTWDERIQIEIETIKKIIE